MFQETGSDYMALTAISMAQVGLGPWSTHLHLVI